MGRKRVSKGAVIVKKDEKIATVIKGVGGDADFYTFYEAFKTTYPKDWNRVCARYQQHECLTKPGKSHPMAPPLKYMENVFRQFHKKLKELGQTPDEFLSILQLPKSERPEFQDGEPLRGLNKMLKGVKHSDVERRTNFVHCLGKHRCDATMQALRETMSGDSVRDVRLLAYKKLCRFGVEGLPRPE